MCAGSRNGTLVERSGWWNQAGMGSGLGSEFGMLPVLSVARCWSRRKGLGSRAYGLRNVLRRDDFF